MRLLCLADLHLGAHPSLGRDPGSRLADQDAVLKHILGRAIEHDAEAILIAGDVFDGPGVTTEEQDVFADFVDECWHREIPIVATVGNGKHDLSMRSVNGLAIFDRLPGIDVYARPGVHDLGGVRVACMPWASPARLVATHAEAQDVPRERIVEEAQRLLVVVARGLREDCGDAVSSVLMLHGSLSGASIPSGLSTQQLGAVIDTGELLDLGFSAIVGGHIHKSQLATPMGIWAPALSHDPMTFATSVALYTGSPLPLDFSEAGEAHGVWILDVDSDAVSAEFVPIESRPLQQTTFDIADLPEDDATNLIYDPAAWPEVADAIVKVTVRCTQAQRRRLDVARLREAVLAAGAHTVKVETEMVRVERSRVEGVTGDIDPLAAYDAWVSANPVEPELATVMREQLVRDLETVGA